MKIVGHVLMAVLGLLVINLPSKADELTFEMPVSSASIVPNCDYNSTTCRHPGLHHTGIDLTGSLIVHPTAPGKVVVIVSMGTPNCYIDHGMGNVVIVQHELDVGRHLPKQVYSLYAHLDSIDSSISVGVYVDKTTNLGKMGGSGSYYNDQQERICDRYKYGTHLHFEIKDLPVIENPYGGNACSYPSGFGRCWGYTPDNSDNYGYHNPADFLGSARVLAPMCTAGLAQICGQPPAVTPPTQHPTPEINSISPSSTTALNFTLTILGNNFDNGAIDVIQYGDGAVFGHGTVTSRNSTQVITTEYMTGAEPGTYWVRVKNSDKQYSNAVALTITGAAPSIPTTPSPPQSCGGDLSLILGDWDYTTINSEGGQNAGVFTFSSSGGCLTLSVFSQNAANYGQICNLTYQPGFNAASRSLYVVESGTCTLRSGAVGQVSGTLTGQLSSDGTTLTGTTDETVSGGQGAHASATFRAVRRGSGPVGLIPPRPSNPPQQAYLSGLSAPSGPGGMSVVVSGGNFSGGSQVTFDGRPVPTVFLSSSQLQFTVPQAACGAHTVGVSGALNSLPFSIPCQPGTVTPPQPSQALPVVHFVINATDVGTTIVENQTVDVPIYPGHSTAHFAFDGGHTTTTGYITAWQWLINGTPVANTQGFQFDLGPGTHNILLRVTDNNNQTAAAGATINVTAPQGTGGGPPPPPAGGGPAAHITIASDQGTIHENQTLNYTLAPGQAVAHFSFDGTGSTGQIVAYQWFINGTPVNSTPTMQYDLDANQHLIQLWVTDANGQVAKIGATIVVTAQSSGTPPPPPPPPPPGPPPPSAMSVSAIQFHPTGARSTQFVLGITGQAIASARLQVLNLQGQTVFDSGFQRGSNLYWTALDSSGRPLANGVYFYLVTVRGYDGKVIRSEVKKVVIMR